MKEFTVKALMYILNTNGGATPEIFIEDHAPIGQKLWDEIFGGEYIKLEDNRSILLTNKGMNALRVFLAPEARKAVLK